MGFRMVTGHVTVKNRSRVAYMNSVALTTECPSIISLTSNYFIVNFWLIHFSIPILYNSIKIIFQGSPPKQTIVVKTGRSMEMTQMTKVGRSIRFKMRDQRKWTAPTLKTEQSFWTKVNGRREYFWRSLLITGTVHWRHMTAHFHPLPPTSTRSVMDVHFRVTFYFHLLDRPLSTCL